MVDTLGYEDERANEKQKASWTRDPPCHLLFVNCQTLTTVYVLV